jgi:hypothetical protein
MCQCDEDLERHLSDEWNESKAHLENTILRSRDVPGNFDATAGGQDQAMIEGPGGTMFGGAMQTTVGMSNSKGGRRKKGMSAKEMKYAGQRCVGSALTLPHF